MNALYQIFRDEVYALCYTLVYKSEATAQALNRALLERGWEVNPEDPYTWKYYLNLAGEYHPIDLPMTVISLDNLEEIAFTKANLAQHRATAKAYVHGTPYYLELVRRFPKQVDLIHGILNPIRRSVSIAAPDHQILYYDQKLVEPQEQDLIPRLQKFIDAYYYNWHNAAYSITHDLYDGYSVGVLATQLPAEVERIRLDLVHTEQTHSYHIWMYLRSNGRLDEFRNYLTTRQALWLYRNIRYLQANAGKQSTFETLIEHLLTERGLPVVHYEALKDLSKLPDQGLVADIILHPTGLNLPDSQEANPTPRTPEYILEKQFPLAPGNQDNYANAIEHIRKKWATTIRAKSPTKVLESRAVDRSGNVPFLLEDVIVNHWLYWACTGRYNVMFQFQSPISGEGFNLNPRDAFCLWVWCVNRGNGRKEDRLVDWVAERVRRNRMPSKADLRTLVVTERLPDSMFDLVYGMMPAVSSVVSVDAFYKQCVAIHTGALQQYDYYTQFQNYHDRCAAEAVVGHFYADVGVALATETTYTEWFRNRGLPFSDMSAKDAMELGEQIVKQATGIGSITTYSVREIQEAMLRLLHRLSSYTIQSIRSESSDASVPVGVPIIRLGDEDNYTAGTEKHRLQPTRVENDSSRSRSAQAVAGKLGNLDIATSSREYSVAQIDVCPDFTVITAHSEKVRIRTGSLRYRDITPE